MKLLYFLFWSIRYRLYNRDLYAALRAGRGTKDDPLTIQDLKPLMKALDRLSSIKQGSS